MTTDDPLDPLIHAPARLRIVVTLAALRDGDALSFTRLQSLIGLTPGNLSKHLTVLEQAGMVEVEKGYAGRRPRTWVRITAQGRAALAAELATLTELLRRHTASRGT